MNRFSITRMAKKEKEMRKGMVGFVLLVMVVFAASPAMAAYDHQGEMDSDNFTALYPDKVATKLDHCALCHTGGEYIDDRDRTVTAGSCQYCHATYGYDGSGDIFGTLNSYGKDYLANGRNQAAVQAIEGTDSDGDTYSNKAEIDAVRYPGDASDDPSKIPAPFRVYTKAQLEAMPQHTQFLLLNTSRSGDFYAEYSGVVMEQLLNDASALNSATGIRVYAPDGFSNDHPINPVDSPSLYHVNGVYPEAVYHYQAQADQALNPEIGWCDYSAPSCQGRNDQDLIVNPDGLKLILAVKRDGAYMDPGVLNEDNSLDGEGPFRVAPPQKVTSPPDQSSRAEDQNVIWPYTEDWDHNAGFSSRSATIIRVEPLPEGTTDVNILEAGWQYVDEGKILVYGALAGGDACPVATADSTTAGIVAPSVEYMGARYQATFTFYPNPEDPAGLYWTLGSVTPAAAGARNTTFVAVDENANIDIPCILYNGAVYHLTLAPYANPSDPNGVYWVLNSVSVTQ
ncbi:MAG: hypothetical protein HY788_09605 [Deltaproteobacteria bacterium]|nr:hypothetical protein [Deltaproteobacteria bacterium]